MHNQVRKLLVGFGLREILLATCCPHDRTARRLLTLQRGWPQSRDSQSYGLSVQYRARRTRLPQIGSSFSQIITIHGHDSALPASARTRDGEFLALHWPFLGGNSAPLLLNSPAAIHLLESRPLGNEHRKSITSCKRSAVR